MSAELPPLTTRPQANDLRGIWLRSTSNSRRSYVSTVDTY